MAPRKSGQISSRYPASNAVTRGFRKLDGMGLELVCRAEHRCGSSGAPLGASPKLPRGRVGQGNVTKPSISGYNPSPPRNQKNCFNCIAPVPGPADRRVDRDVDAGVFLRRHRASLCSLFFVQACMHRASSDAADARRPTTASLQ